MPICIYKPKVVQKRVPTRTGNLEHGAELYYLDDEDVGKEEESPDYFKIKLAYNGVHHYMPIVPSSVCTYLDAWGNASYYTSRARESLKLFRNQIPKNTNYCKLVDCAYNQGNKI